jgi:hypothetical protein
MKTTTNPTTERSIFLAFSVTGILFLAFGLPALLVGMFTGTQILVPALGMFVTGAASVAVGFGIVAGSRRARLIGIVLAALLATACATAVAATIVDSGETRPTRVPVTLMAVAFAAPVTVAGGMLLRDELRRRRASLTTSPEPPSA